MNKAAKGLLASLATTRNLDEAKKYVAALEREHGFTWRPVGDRENNYGSINMGSNPGHAFVERVTNAIDAVIDREALRKRAKAKGKGMPATPREAVETWFGVPGGRVSNLPSLKARQALADEVVIRLLDSNSKKCPTVEIRDRGVGLTPRLLPRTILSLGAENKINKPYLAGAYGQGGSTALAFSPLGCLIVSRRHQDLIEPSDEDLVAVTFARFNELDPDRNKNGRYEYLVKADNEVAGLSPALVGDFEPGTAVVHFNLDIPQYSERLTQLTNSMWWLLQNTLFDPVLPLWAEEHRSAMVKGQPDRRTIAGNYTRLMDDKKDRVEHHDHVEVNLGHATGDTPVRVNYWVIRANPENKTSQPIDAYVDVHRPVTYTFFGQTHGTDDRRFVSERLYLPHLAKFLIIQVELDRLSPHARRELLSTTRDRLKELGFYNTMRERIREALSEDPELIRLNDERKEALLSRHSEAEQAKMQERFAKLMERFKAGVDATAKGKGDTGPGRRATEPGGREPLEPLPTKEKPTFIRIGNTQKPLPIRIDRYALLRLESDAPDGYLAAHVHARLIMVCDPDGLVALDSKSDFRGGRARMTVRPTDRAKPGDTGTLSVYLITPEDKQIPAKISFRIDAPEEQPTTGPSGRAKVQVPKPIPVSKEEWATLGWDANDVAEVRQDNKDTEILVNMDNKHIAKLLHGANYQEMGIKRMRNNYLLYVAFYSWAQFTAMKSKDFQIDEAQYEEYLAGELDRVAQTVVHSISALNRLEDEEQ